MTPAAPSFPLPENTQNGLFSYSVKKLISYFEQAANLLVEEEKKMLPGDLLTAQFHCAQVKGVLAMRVLNAYSGSGIERVTFREPIKGATDIVKNSALVPA